MPKLSAATAGKLQRRLPAAAKSRTSNACSNQSLLVANRAHQRVVDVQVFEKQLPPALLSEVAHNLSRGQQTRQKAVRVVVGDEVQDRETTVRAFIFRQLSAISASV